MIRTARRLRALLPALALLAAGSCQGPETFTGTLEYQVTLRLANGQDAQMLGLMRSLTPSKYVLYVTEDALRTEIEMQRRQVVSLFTTDNSTAYMLDSASRQAISMPLDTVRAQMKRQSAAAGQPTVTPTDERQDILGQPCRKFLISSKTETAGMPPVNMAVWASERLTFPKAFASLNPSMPYQYDAIPGLPLKVEITNGEGPAAMVMEVLCVRMDNGMPNAAKLTVPQDYRTVDMETMRRQSAPLQAPAEPPMGPRP